jgi:hypothetical protein
VIGELAGVLPVKTDGKPAPAAPARPA